jgi:hypothetical protein
VGSVGSPNCAEYLNRRQRPTLSQKGVLRKQAEEFCRLRQHLVSESPEPATPSKLQHERSRMIVVTGDSTFSSATIEANVLVQVSKAWL